MLLLNAFLLMTFYNRSWAPHDDGYWAHVAERVLRGSILNQEIQSRHTGFLHFLNAEIFTLFGVHLKSLRLPLLFLSLLQSLLVFRFFPKEKWLEAFLAGVAITALGYIQSPTPASHWYCLFLTLLLASWIHGVPISQRGRILAAGFLCGMIFLFRQLSGIFVGIGLLAYLALESNNSNKSPAFFAKALIGLSILWLTHYLIQAGSLLSFALLGFWPLYFLFLCLIRTRQNSFETLRVLASLGIGFFLAVLPLLIYLCQHGAFRIWWRDIYVQASQMIESMPYKNWSDYALYIVGGLAQFTQGPSLALRANGLYWFFLPLMAFLNGFILMILFRKKVPIRELGLSFFSIFFALTSHTLAIPIYLYYSVGFSLVSLLFLSHLFPLRGLSLLSGFLILVGIYFHAGQPAQRGSESILRGERESLVQSQINKINLFIQPKDEALYRDILQTIDDLSLPEETIWVFPNNPEIYFLADRQNASRINFLPMALKSSEDVEEFSQKLFSESPALILFNSRDKYNTEASRRLIEKIRARFDQVKEIGDFEIYRDRSKPRRP